MHNLFAGVFGIFAGIATFFHGGAAIAHSPATHMQTVQQASTSGTQASPSGLMKKREGWDAKLPQGERPFFGTVTAVNGSTLTVQMRAIPVRRNNTTPTPTSPQTITITLTSATKYTGGSQSNITTNTRIAGIGKTNTDGSLTAIQVRINPTIPTGFAHREGFEQHQINH